MGFGIQGLGYRVSDCFRLVAQFGILLGHFLCGLWVEFPWLGVRRLDSITLAIPTRNHEATRTTLKAVYIRFSLIPLPKFYLSDFPVFLRPSGITATFLRTGPSHQIECPLKARYAKASRFPRRSLSSSLLQWLHRNFRSILFGV